MDNTAATEITVVMVKLEAEQFHPFKSGKYFFVLEELTGAYKVIDCDGNDYDLFAQDVNTYTWRIKDWRDYCSR